MRRININNPEELKKFKMETKGFVSSYGFPYRLDALTEKGANYTIFCPLKWKSAFSPAKLHKLLREDVDVGKIHVEYIDFVKEATDVLYELEEFIDTLEVKEVDLENSMVCKIDWYDGFLLDYTQEQQDNLLEKIGANVGDKIRVILIKE